MIELILIAVFGLGVWILSAGYRRLREVSKYEFENRTDGGVVQFSDHAASIRHAQKAYIGLMLRNIGVPIVVVGVLALGFRVFYLIVT